MPEKTADFETLAKAVDEAAAAVSGLPEARGRVDQGPDVNPGSRA